MRELFQTVGGFVVAVALVIGVVFGVSYCGFYLYKEFAPKYQEVDSQVYKSTPSYIDGKAQMLTKIRLDLARASGEAEKATLRELALREAATVDRSKLPTEIQSWLVGLETLAESR